MTISGWFKVYVVFLMALGISQHYILERSENLLQEAIVVLATRTREKQK